MPAWNTVKLSGFQAEGIVSLELPPKDSDSVFESPTGAEAPTRVVRREAVPTLGGNELLGLLGRGGMGEVWLGRDPKLDRRVAIKTVRRDLAENEEALARFYREARAVAKLSHPNIIQIFQIGEENSLL